MDLDLTCRLCSSGTEAGGPIVMWTLEVQIHLGCMHVLQMILVC